MDVFLYNLPIILCFLAGLFFLTFEVFVPGFGVAGITGIVLECITIVLTFMKHGGLIAILTTVFIVIIIALCVFLCLRSIKKGKLFKSSIILSDEEKVEDGYIATKDRAIFLHKTGVTTTPLRPTGMADIQGERLNVITNGQFVPNDTPVRVVRIEGANIIVQPIKEEKE